MSLNYNFSKALLNNIERTYTYAYAKNAHQFERKPEQYDPLSFFLTLMSDDPFGAFMALEGYAFKKALNDLNRYSVPYTAEQKRRAQVYADVTEKMIHQRSDYISYYVEDIENTGVTLYRDPYVLTTKKTIQVTEAIKALPTHAQIPNVIYENKLNAQLLNSKEQYDALKTCLKHKISCLIGGAGTGKSFVTASIIDQLALNGKKTAILAPTHKAREALQDKLKTGTVRTIHSFVHKPENCDVIVIDESGMLSTPLFHSLMRIYDNQQLIFVGDKNQIPPVDYGRPFELIQERFVTSELKDNKRAESADIIALGREILGIPQNANMAHNNIEVVATTKEAFARGAEVVLTYTNSNVKTVNEEQRIKGGVRSISPEFSVGDLIIAKTNQRGHYYNGQIFKIISPTMAANQKNGHIVNFNTPKDLEYNFSLAYGLTIHKSQGSEWDVVAYQPSELDTQNLAYVAVTRAKKKLIIVGDGIKEKYPADRKWQQLKL